MALPASNVWVHRVPVDLDIAAIFDPFGNAVHTALSFPLVGEDVLITGAGPIGIMASAIVRHIGARHVVVTDVNRYRLDMAAKHGASRVVDVSQESLVATMNELEMTEGFDVGLEMSGAEAAFNQMIDVMNNGGRIAVLGIPSGPMTLDVNDVIFKGLTLYGVTGRKMYSTWNAMARFIKSGEFDPSPVVALNRAVALGELEGPDAALGALEGLDLDGYHLFHATRAEMLRRKGDLAGILTNLAENDVLFIDEIHRMNPAIEENLYPAMESFTFDIVIGDGAGARALKLPLQRFTLIGATTRTGLLTGPLRDRFGITVAGGHGELGERMFRIGHIGYYDIFDITTALAAVELLLVEQGADVERGAAVAAALETYRAAVRA